MSCPDQADLDAVDAAILAAASGPLEVTVDGMTTKMRPAADLIALEKRVKSRAAACSGNLGWRLLQVKPPGAV
jgi:hypothetical protein